IDLRLRFPWRRFPYALTVPAAAPPGVAGPFEVESASPRRLVARRGQVRLVFSRLVAVDAVRAWRDGEVDDAPVPLGDLPRLKLDHAIGPFVHVRPLMGVDLVRFRLRSEPLADLPRTRRVYWQTANRGDYAQLVAGGGASPAFSVAGSGRAPGPAALRQARRDIASLPPVSVPIAAPADPELRYAAETLVADWRELGLGARVVTGSAGARFERVVAAYPQDEALPAALLLPGDSRARMLLLDALARRDQTGALARVDAALRAEAAVVPIAGVASARLVSPRLAGWRQDVLGVVDYSSVRVRASTRSP
ncbi:MAG: Bacterial extracellular solute-binding protein family 5 Middle, partial [Gaiellaceae bacterium]|nr:Bacterial extracellular solute-binding protein family 5 Middle [Gaiellaceae bacterium]